MSNDDATGGLTATFAEQLVSDIIKPTYRQQLLQGIQAQSTWKKYSHVCEILSHFFSAATTFTGSYSIYANNTTVQAITVAFAVLTQLSKAFASYSSSEQMKIEQNNTIVTNHILKSIAKGNNSDNTVGSVTTAAANSDNDQKENATGTDTNV